jgi:hypothetical protein
VLGLWLTPEFFSHITGSQPSRASPGRGAAAAMEWSSAPQECQPVCNSRWQQCADLGPSQHGLHRSVLVDNVFFLLLPLLVPTENTRACNIQAQSLGAECRLLRHNSRSNLEPCSHEYCCLLMCSAQGRSPVRTACQSEMSASPMQVNTALSVAVMTASSGCGISGEE